MVGGCWSSMQLNCEPDLVLVAEEDDTGDWAVIAKPLLRISSQIRLLSRWYRWAQTVCPESVDGYSGTNLLFLGLNSIKQDDFTQESDKKTVFLIDRLQQVYYSCQKIPMMRSPQEKILFSLFHLAVGASQHCHLRVNEAGQSICSGRMVVEVKFCCLGLVEPARARLWFRHEWKRNRFRERVNEQSQESAIVMIKLEADEVLDVLTRIQFLGQEEWGTSSGQPRVITKWGRLWSRGSSFMIVKNEAVETYDMAAHRFELATSDGIRRC